MVIILLKGQTLSTISRRVKQYIGTPTLKTLSLFYPDPFPNENQLGSMFLGTKKVKYIS